MIIDMPILDTRTNKDLTGTLISDIVLQLLSYVAQAKWEFNRQRQAEGIAIAKANGKHLGKPQKPYPDKFETYFILWKEEKITFDETKVKLQLKKSQLRWSIRRRKKEISGW